MICPVAFWNKGWRMSLCKQGCGSPKKGISPWSELINKNFGHSMMILSIFILRQFPSHSETKHIFLIQPLVDVRYSRVQLELDSWAKNRLALSGFIRGCYRCLLLALICIVLSCCNVYRCLHFPAPQCNLHIKSLTGDFVQALIAIVYDFPSASRWFWAISWNE